MKRSIGSSNSLLRSVAILLSALGCAAVITCAAVTVTRENVPEAVQDFQDSVATGEGLSQISLQYMRMHALDAATAEDPIAFFKSLGNKSSHIYTMIIIVVIVHTDSSC